RGKICHLVFELREGADVMDAALLVESAATGSARILPRAARTAVNATLGSTMRSVAPTIAANSSRKSNSGAAPNKVDSIGMETILGPIGGATHRSHRDAQWHRYRAVVHVQTHRSRRGSAGMFLAGQPGQAPAERAVPAQPGRSSWGAPRCIKPPVDL